MLFLFEKWPTFCVSILKQFGEIEDCQIDEQNLRAVITYRTRPEAEQVGYLPLKQKLKMFFSDIQMVEKCK